MSQTRQAPETVQVLDGEARLGQVVYAIEPATGDLLAHLVERVGVQSDGSPLLVSGWRMLRPLECWCDRLAALAHKRRLDEVALAYHRERVARLEEAMRRDPPPPPRVRVVEVESADPPAGGGGGG